MRLGGEDGARGIGGGSRPVSRAAGWNKEREDQDVHISHMKL